MPIDRQDVESWRSRVFAPTENVSSPASWCSWLGGTLPDYNGNFYRSGVLLANFQDGIEYIISRFSRLGLHPSKPTLGITLDDQLSKGVIACSNIGQAIFVKESFLASCSRYDLKKMYDMYRGEGDHIRLQGTFPDMFKMFGVEEGHHSIYMQVKEDINGPDPTVMGMEEYDAQEVEYRALIWQLRCAREMELPNWSILRLHLRLIRARQLRKKLAE